MSLLDDVDELLGRVDADLADHHWSTIAAVEEWLDAYPMPGPDCRRPLLQVFCDLCGCFDGHTDGECAYLLGSWTHARRAFSWLAAPAEGHDPSGPRLGPGLEPEPIATPTLGELAALPILSPALAMRAIDLIAQRAGGVLGTWQQIISVGGEVDDERGIAHEPLYPNLFEVRENHDAGVSNDGTSFEWSFSPAGIRHVVIRADGTVASDFTFGGDLHYAHPTLPRRAARLAALERAGAGLLGPVIFDEVQRFADWQALRVLDHAGGGPATPPAVVDERTIEERAAAAAAAIADRDPVDLTPGEVDVARVTWSASLPPARRVPSPQEQLLAQLRERRWPR